MIRIVGTFVPQGGGSTVEYRIELMPVALIALAISVLITVAILAALIKVEHLPVGVLGLWIVVLLLEAGANIWISERQGAWLKDCVASVLDAQGR